MSIKNAITNLVQSSKSTAINIAYITKPTHNTKRNPFYDSTNKKWLIEKVGVMNGLTGVSYQNSVNNALTRSGENPDFMSKPIWRGKGQHVNKFLIEHTDTKRLYLKVLPNENSIQYRYRWIDSKVELSDNEMRQLNEFKTKSAEHLVGWNLIDLENIVQLTFNHTTYS